MENFSIDKLMLIMYFFVPGFISMSFYRLVFALERIDYSKSLYEALGISCINFSLLFYPIYLINQKAFLIDHIFLYALLTIFIIFIVPIILTLLYSRIVKTKKFQKNFVSPEKTPWDWLFSKRESYWVIITLKDGKKIGGKYGLKSRASAFPAAREIFIEDVWKLDKDCVFKESLKRNSGLIIFNDNILTIEFFK